MCGDWGEGGVFGHGLVLVEDLGVEALPGESDLGVGEMLVELALDTFILQSKGLAEAIVVELLPAV